MSLTYTTEGYTTQQDRTTIETTEYRFSDGTRYVKMVRRTPREFGFKYDIKTKVLVSEFEGDNETRTTLRDLTAALATADEAEALTPEEPAASTEPYRIEAGYEDQALPMTPRQTAVLNALHTNLNLTAPFDVLPPVKGNRDLTASTSSAGSRFLVEVDPEGYIDRVAVKHTIAGMTEWAELGRSDRSTHFYDRVRLVAREARLTVPADTNGTNAAE